MFVFNVPLTALPVSPQIIFTSNVQNIGEIGDIKMVPLGYWRNFLMPNNLAALADENVLL